MVCERACEKAFSGKAFFGVALLLFATGAAITIVKCGSMSAMGGMPMPGGWTMSMAWMRMPGQTWPRAAVSFLSMWLVMMVAMMLPSLLPVLWRYHQAVGIAGGTRPGRLAALVGVAYFLVWTVFGMAAFPLGVVLAAGEMQLPALARAVPIGVGVVVVIAGALQFTACKAHHLACCRAVPRHGRALAADAGTAWRHGLRLGLHCSTCCAGLMTILLVIGVMDLRAMAAVTAAITVEFPAAIDPEPSLAHVRYPATLRCVVAAESGRSAVVRVDGQASAQTDSLRRDDAGTRFPRPFRK